MKAPISVSVRILIALSISLAISLTSIHFSYVSFSKTPLTLVNATSEFQKSFKHLQKLQCSFNQAQALLEQKKDAEKAKELNTNENIKKLFNKDIDNALDSIINYSKQWDTQQQKMVEKLTTQINQKLNPKYMTIIKLNDKDLPDEYVSEINQATLKCTSEIQELIDHTSASFEEQQKIAAAQIQRPPMLLVFTVLLIGITILVYGFIQKMTFSTLTYYIETTEKILNEESKEKYREFPDSKLKRLSSLLNKFTERIRTDNEMFADLKSNMKKEKRKLEIANHAIKEKNERLNQKTEEITTQRDEIEAQKEIVSTQNQNITDSIRYAEYIQKSILPLHQNITNIFPENFIFYQPRDIVSGDFYWMKETWGSVYIAAADCTGHGVPGAFMSMLGISFLNEIVGKTCHDSAAEVLNKLRNKIKSAMNQDGEMSRRDGMDMTLCKFDFEKEQLEFAGAYNPLYMLRDGELQEFSGDRQPVAIYPKEKPFTNNIIELKVGDTFYLFSDGYIDQAGGKNFRKFRAKRFKQIITDNKDKPLPEQQAELEKAMDEWMKGYEQVDDMLIMGLRYAERDV